MALQITNGYYPLNEIFSIALDSQLDLFDELSHMNSTPLKYPRRKSRNIGNKTYEIEAPKDTVSNAMQKVRSTNTSIEQILEEKLIQNKIAFSKPKNVIENIDGNPDFVIPKYRIAIFCDGDFWHGYNYKTNTIKSNPEFWNAKIENNILRDSAVTYSLENREWKVFRFWEHDIKNNAEQCITQIKDYIQSLRVIKEPAFTFVDLFAGIGGFRIALEQLGGKCLGFSEINNQAIDVYKRNFIDYLNDDEVELGSITNLGKLPFDNIDLIVGGVPCQAWSVAGKRKGFDDPRGKLWHDSIRVIDLNKPKAFIFENVKGLMDPRNKSSLDLIITSLKELGYRVKHSLLNSHDYGIPQNRDRIFLVGIRQDLAPGLNTFKFPNHIQNKTLLKDLIDGVDKEKDFRKTAFDPKVLHGEKLPIGRNRFQKNDELNDFFIFCDTRNGHTTIHSWDIIKTSEKEKEICLAILRNRRKKIYGNADGNPLSFEVLKTLVPNLKSSDLDKLVKKNILRVIENTGYEFVNSKNSSGINGIYRVYMPHSTIFSTLTATGTKDMIALKSISGDSPDEYKENFIKEIVKKKLFRPISAKESGRLQGFPSAFIMHENENEAKKQFGNAVTTTVIYYLTNALIETKLFI